jgi:UDP-glucose 4-epimerase
VALRYFNAAGSDPDGEIGESHEPETHLLPLAIGAALGLRPPLSLFGDDYPTKDGTCVRDYVHVCDLADAHVAALDHLNASEEACAESFNLCNEQGFSVTEVVGAVEEVLGKRVPIQRGARRPGDPPILIGQSTRAREQLGWRPKYADLHTQVEHAARWLGTLRNC